MTDKKDGANSVRSNELLGCPICKREYPIDCEQTRAITKRGKCICCIFDAKEYIEMNPYEFRAT